MAKFVVPKPPVLHRPEGPKTFDPAKPEPGATSDGVKAASFTMKEAGISETILAGALPAAVPFAINAISDVHEENKRRRAYRDALIQQLHPAPKFASILTPVKRQLGSYAEGLMQDTTDQLNQATRVPAVSVVPFNSVPPVRNIL
jgi:hypothetical protein